MTYLIDVPVEGGGQLLVEATEVDLPADLVLAARPGEVLARPDRPSNRPWTSSGRRFRRYGTDSRRWPRTR